MVPLIDVIFLLLTFFIYSLMMMVQAEILPIQLSPLATGEPAEPAFIGAITIDRVGRLYLNRQPLGEQELDVRLREMARMDQPPKLFVAMEVEQDLAGEERGVATVDRGPLLISLIERVRGAGLTDFNIVGQPRNRENIAGD